MALIDLAVTHAVFGLVRLALAVVAVVAAVGRSEGDGCEDVVVFLFGFAVVQVLGLVAMLVHLPLVSLKNKHRSLANRVFTCKPVAGYVFLGIGALIAILHLIFLVPISFILSRDGEDSCSDNDFGTWLLIVCIIAFAEIGCTFLMLLVLSFFKKERVNGPDSGSGAKAGSKKGQPSVILNPDDSEDMLRLEDPSQFMVNEERAALFLQPNAPQPSSSSSSDSDSGSMVGGYQQSSGSTSLTGTSTSGTGSLTGSSTPPSQSVSASASVSASVSVSTSVSDSAPSSTANNPSDDESATSSSSSSSPSASSSTSGPASPSLSDSSTAVSISDTRSSSSGSDISGSLSSGSGTGSSDSATSTSEAS
eukprot:TRINITY_DN107_c1_g1_i1.p1 TRINITY_DN107_c1_g1~~TRINITY_DN107_c1_g1_i1.p1  ORF type:complete len:364 (-),score=53.89 TRINITY_DN107_c1_g1_i1:669-1760(-)